MLKLKVPIALAVALAGVGWLAWSGVSKNDLYMSTLDEWDPTRARHEPVRVVGFVEEGSIVEEPDRLVTRFALRNEARSTTLPARFVGVTPDLFREGSSVVMTGTLDDAGVFVATDLMTKCPSKYEEAAGGPQAAGEGTPAVPGTLRGEPGG